jgi:hypothetical protein
MNFQFHQALRWRIGILRLRINPSQGIWCYDNFSVRW